MKKTIKRLFALLFALVLCLTLCSCVDIKEMRASQAFYGENGEVIWGKQVYKPICDASEMPEELEFNSAGFGNVTEKDVPVLLSDMYGRDMYYNHNKTLIDADVYYAREDIYDYVLDLIKYPELDEYCVEVTNGYQTEYQPLKQRYLNAIEEVIYGGNEIFTDYEDYDYEDYEEIATKDYADIYKCDEKMVFQSLAYRVEERENGDMILSSFITQDIYDYDEFYYKEYSIPDDKKAMMKELLTLGEDGLL